VIAAAKRCFPAVACRGLPRAAVLCVGSPYWKSPLRIKGVRDWWAIDLWVIGHSSTSGHISEEGGLDLLNALPALFFLVFVLMVSVWIMLMRTRQRLVMVGMGMSRARSNRIRVIV